MYALYLLNALYFLTSSGSSKKANHGPTQGYLANPGPEVGGGASGGLSEAGRPGRLDPANPLMATAQGRSPGSDGLDPSPMGRGRLTELKGNESFGRTESCVLSGGKRPGTLKVEGSSCSLKEKWPSRPSIAQRVGRGSRLCL